MRDDEEPTAGSLLRSLARGGSRILESLSGILPGADLDELAPKLGGIEGDVRERWRPVVSAARDVGIHVVQLGWYLWRAEGDAETSELLERLNCRTSQLISAFPNVADLYGDVDRLDAWLDRRARTAEFQSAVSLYFEWIEHVVDGIVRRIVDRALGIEESEIEAERAEQFLARLDSMLREILERWVVDSALDPAPTRSDRSRPHGPADSTPEKEEP